MLSSSTGRLIDTQVPNYQSDSNAVVDQFEKPQSGFMHGIRMKLKPEYREQQNNLQRMARDLDYARQEAEIELLDKQEEKKQFDVRFNNWDKLSGDKKDAYDAFSRYVSSTGKDMYRLKLINEAIRAGRPVEIPLL